MCKVTICRNMLLFNLVVWYQCIGGICCLPLVQPLNHPLHGHCSCSQFCLYFIFLFYSRQEQEIFLYSKMFRAALRPNQSPIQRILGCFLGVKWPARNADHFPSSCVEVKNECSCTSTPSLCLHCLKRDSFTLYCQSLLFFPCFFVSSLWNICFHMFIYFNLFLSH